MPAPEFASSPDLQDDLQMIAHAARRAGEIALGYFGRDPRVWTKEGDSPVSEADQAADDYLRTTLLDMRPDYGWLSEEAAEDQNKRDSRRLFIVDPIDGTRGFLEGNRKWCVSIAIVEDGRPVCAVLECPALAETYTAARNTGVWLNGGILTTSEPGLALRIGGPKPLVRGFGEKTGLDVTATPFDPSLAYRLTSVASGALDGAYARPNCHDWDIAAADLIMREAGARLTGLDGHKIRYNRSDITHGVLVAAREPLHLSMLKSAKSQLKNQGEY